MERCKKCFCFSKTEFAVMTMAYGIEKLVCFQEPEKEEWSPLQQSEEYNRAVFGLYKKAMLENSENGLKVSKEAKSIFSILKECRAVLTTETKNVAISGYCLYFGQNEDFIILRPGTRVGEYIKAERARKEELQEFLEESGILPEETISEKFLEDRQEFPIIGDTILQLLSQDNIKTSEHLRCLTEAETIMVLREPITGIEIACIGILHQPLQDKIIWMEGKEIKLFPYSIKKTMEVLETLLKS